MQDKRFFSIIILLILSFGMTRVFAIMSIPCGWYAEVNVGTAHMSDKDYPGDASTSNLAGNLNIGYKFMPYFAIEAGGSLYSETQIKDAFGHKVAKDKHYSYDAALKGIVPIIDSGFELFAKVGAVHTVAQMSIQNTTIANSVGLTRGKRSSTGLYKGIGGQWYIWPELAVVGQWQRASGNSNSGTWDLYSIGLSFIFY